MLSTKTSPRVAKVGIVDISRNVGLSPATVSYVLSGKYREANIPQQTADRVIESAKKLGYHPNHWARALASQKSKLVGVLFPDLSLSAASQISKGIQEVLDSAGFQSLIGVYRWDRDREAREVDLMLEKRVEVIITLPYAGSAKTYRRAIECGCRVVFVGDYLPDVKAPSVMLDPVDAIRQILSHLCKLGHKKIHLLGIDYDSPTQREREAAFRQGLHKLGIPFCEKNISYTVLSELSTVREQVRLLMAREDRPTALICICDALAFPAFAELAELGVKVPNELAVASIGNETMSDHPFFALTTVDEMREDLGRRAAELALRRQDAFGSVEHILVKGKLFERGSTLGKGIIYGS